ncbi:hypothetical protein [Thauera sp.]|uniref:phage fiber-tail adaptor protein n=1 Tax=Thauera sp. TaxID=1905334 RepID=UPI0039E5A76F
MIKRLPEKRPAEAVTVTFRFARELGEGVTLAPGATVVVTVRKGVDAAPQAMLAGVPAVSGTNVLARLLGGLAGTEYLLSCTADTSNGDRLVLDAVLPVTGPR